MSRRLFIFLPAEEDAPVHWLLMEDVEAGPDIEIREGLEQASLHATGSRVIVIAPGQSVVLASARIPSRNRQRILSALPYMLEDQLISEVERLHFALGQRDADGLVSTAIVDRELMTAWLARLRSFDIEPDMVTPDLLCLPLSPGHWTLLHGAHHSLMRTGPQSGSVIDNDNLVAITGLLLDEAAGRLPETIDCFSHDPQALPLGELEAAVAVSVETLDAPVPAFLARHFQEGNSINLLQGEFSRREQLGRLWRPWLPALGLLAALLLINGAVTIADYFRLGKEQARLVEHNKQIYRDAFPQSRRVVNPRAQMEQGLEKLRSGGGLMSSGFLDILKASGADFSKTKGLVLQRFSYRDGRLDIALTIPDLQALDKLKERLVKDAGLLVEIQSASARNGKVEARMQLRRAAS